MAAEERSVNTHVTVAEPSVNVHMKDMNFLNSRDD